MKLLNFKEEVDVILNYDFPDINSACYSIGNTLSVLQIKLIPKTSTLFNCEYGAFNKSNWR